MLFAIILSGLLVTMPKNGYCEAPSKISTEQTTSIVEPSTQPNKSDLANKPSDKEKQSVANEKKKLELFQETIVSVREQAQETKHSMELAKKENWPKPLIKITEENVKLVNEILETDINIRQTKSNIAELEKRLKILKKSHDETKNQVESMGLTPAVGMLLQKKRPSLIKLELPKRSTIHRSSEIKRINEDDLYLGDMKEQLEKLTDEKISGYLTETKFNPNKQDEIRVKATKLAQNGKTLVDNLSFVNSQYLTLLGKESYAERALRLEAKELISFINMNLLWAKSNQAFGLADVSFLSTSVKRFLNPENWMYLKKDTIRSLKIAWPWWSVTILFLLSWFIFRIKKSKLSKTLTKKDEQIESYSHSFMSTLKIFFVAILSAGIFPFILFFVSRLLTSAPGYNEFTWVISKAIQNFAWIFFFANLAREIVQHKGLGELHFNWSQSACQSIRQFAWWSIILIAPISFVLTVINTGLSMPVRGSLGRIFFVIEMLILAIMLTRLFRPNKSIVTNIKTHGFFAKTNHIALLLSFLIPVSFIVIAIMGYYRSAVLLGNDLMFTIILIGALALLNSFLVRLSNIAKHNIHPKKSSDEIMDRETSKKQINVLIRIAITTLALAGLYGIWFNDIPILNFANSLVLWSYYIGTEIAVTTLGNLILCLLILGFTVLIVKNLSGVLEIVIFKRASFTIGSKHAATLIIKYLVTIVGLTLALNSIGIGWSKFQWLMAALTVGLGFGLQDIVANFASGLIILFERPINIGDTVTVNGISGQVSKMQIRATTITDWDQKDVIIPNKAFLTSNIINWTLSNQVVRVVIPVGVAYGSDAEKTEKLLLKISSEHSLILDNPAPSVIFSNFGDSSLDFNLRVFAQNKNRMMVIHQLHLAINNAFNEEGLEIPFPQQDVHLDAPKTIDVRITKDSK